MTDHTYQQGLEALLAIRRQRAEECRRRQRELSVFARKILKLEHELSMLRHQRDSRLFYWHEEGEMTTEQLACACMFKSRQSVYDAIERYRRRTPFLKAEDERHAAL